MAAGLLIFFIASMLGAMPRDVLLQPQEQPLGAEAVIVTTLVTAIAATLVFGLLVKATKHPVFYFRIVAMIVYILMVALPFRIPGAPAAMILTLLLIHAVVALVLVQSLERGLALADLRDSKQGERNR